MDGDGEDNDADDDVDGDGLDNEDIDEDDEDGDGHHDDEDEDDDNDGEDDEDEDEDEEDEGDEERPEPLVSREALTPASGFEKAYGRVKLVVVGTRTKFEVEIEDVPTGDYELLIGDTVRGVIQVTNHEGNNEGELEFETGGADGNLPLNFDVIAQPVTIRIGEVTYFSGTVGTPVARR